MKLDCSGMKPGRLLRRARERESKFNLNSDDNRVRVWRPHGKRLSPAFALQRHAVRTAGAMVWGVIAYTTSSPPSIDPCHHDSPVILQPRVAIHATAPRSHFSTRQCSASHGKGVTILSPHCYYPSFAYPIPRFVSN
ncbi:transposable element Tcb1 transposase [Trichonephila clavipes]|uniref:Transposable element Tcb1 transposase n=1 Tax=Trichonephila clavipes TaxID=2585209 RepID=A0A8X6VHD2_TRICX|nr:transposable element Tcb1 transposase [Trichonephila clavipes]